MGDSCPGQLPGHTADSALVRKCHYSQGLRLGKVLGTSALDCFDYYG